MSQSHFLWNIECLLLHTGLNNRFYLSCIKEFVITWLAKDSQPTCVTVVPVFGTGGMGKRSMAHELPIQQAVVRLLSLLRDWTVLSAAISLLARLHNVLRDEVSLELICDHTALWPGVVSKWVHLMLLSHLGSSWPPISPFIASYHQYF